MAWFSVLVVFIAVLALSGCGDDGDSSGGSTSNSEVGANADPKPAPQPPPNFGCNSGYPRRVQSTGDLAGQFRACVSDDGASMFVTNTSSMVLVLRNTAKIAPAMSAHSPTSSSSFGDEMVKQSSSAFCHPPGGWCRLPPKATATFEGAPPLQLEVDADAVSTAVATAASSFGNWVQSKLEGRGQAYVGSIKACANAVGGLVSQGQFVEDAMRNAVNAGTDCTSLVSKVTADLRETPAPAEAADEAVRLAGRFTGNLKRDFAVYEALRLVARLPR